MLHSHSRDTISPGHTKPCQLLVSVRNCQEAELCLTAGVDWIDLKEPLAGSLGRPSLEVAQQVALMLADHPRRSVALGEFRDLLAQDPADASTVTLSRLFPIAKVGLAGAQQIPDWQIKLSNLSQSIGRELTPVLYADWQRCSAPRPDEIVSWAVAQKCRYLLIDTFIKDGSRLVDYLDQQRLERILEDAGRAGIRVVLAGSLSMADVDTLIGLPCEALAVRGAVCSGRRHDQISPELLENWVRILADWKCLPSPNGPLTRSMS